MNWQCPRCHNELGELNGWCEYCKYDDNVIVYNPDKFFIREIRIAHITEYGDKTLTPQEELFSVLFNGEVQLVKDMSILDMRAHREKLAEIAFEARARLSAVDKVLDDKVKAGKPKGPTGFERSINSDDKTSEAINTIKTRETRLSKMERVKKNMLNIPGIDPKFVESVMSARNIRDQISKINLGAAGSEAAEPIQQGNATAPKVNNPFAKKD